MRQIRPMKSFRISVALLLTLGFSTLASNLFAAAPFQLATDPRIDPSQFRVTTFASGLPYTTAMQRLSDGSMLVAVNVAPGTYFVRLRSISSCGQSGVSNEILVAIK